MNKVLPVITALFFSKTFIHNLVKRFPESFKITVTNPQNFQQENVLIVISP